MSNGSVDPKYTVMGTQGHGNPTINRKRVYFGSDYDGKTMHLFPLSSDNLEYYDWNFDNFIEYLYQDMEDIDYDKTTNEEIKILYDMWKFAGSPAINVWTDSDREELPETGGNTKKGRANYQIPSSTLEEGGYHAINIMSSEDSNNRKAILLDEYLQELSHAIQYFHLKDGTKKQSKIRLKDFQHQVEQKAGNIREKANEVLRYIGYDVANISGDSWRYNLFGTVEHEAHLGVRKGYDRGVAGILEDYLEKFGDTDAVGPDYDWVLPESSVEELQAIFDDIDFSTSYLDIGKSFINLLTTTYEQYREDERIGEGYQEVYRDGEGGWFGPDWTEEDIDRYFRTTLEGK